MKQRTLKPIMFVGTCSDAGKSILNTAFCRIFLQDGYRPAPFKAQNMSLNSYSTPEGGEMGRAQVVQAEACRIPPHTDMNPVLLKPTGDKGSQVILNGRPIGNLSAKAYFGENGQREELFAEAKAAFDRLRSYYNPVVMEGAGSISELNLRTRDITNMRMAQYAGADTYLVADIDRGGVFASVYGSIALLSPEEKALMKGIIVNKFRGDASLFDEGKRIIEELTGIPVVGIIPYYNHIRIEEEDSVVLEEKNHTFQSGKINVAIVLFKRISNFTDFNVLEMDSRFNAYYTTNVSEIEKADIVILPGSKNTIADLQAIRANGVADAILRAYKTGKKVIGICGGYQMMGARLEDPDHVESNLPAVAGLGLLPQRTILESEKTTLQRHFDFVAGKSRNTGEYPCKGYEIHMGRTERQSAMIPESPVAILENGRYDGYYLSAQCWGSYLHGILENSAVLDDLASGISTEVRQPASFDYAAFKEKQYDLLADLVRKHIDLSYIYCQLESREVVHHNGK